KLISKPYAYELGLEFASQSQTIAHFIVWKTPDDFGRIDLLFSIPLAPGRHHIAATLGNSTNNIVRTIFLDGFPVIASSSDSLPSGLAASSSPLTIGGGTTNQFHGWIDEVRLSRIVRYTNDAPVGSHVSYRIPPSPLTSDSNTVALWHFDEPPGATTFRD